MKRPTIREVLSAPNAISATGFGLVAKGSIESDPTKALLYTAAGRSLDLIDGVAARALHQESDFGAGVDALLDKTGMAVAVGSALYHKRMPAVAAAAIVAHNVLNSAASIAHEVRHPDTPARPSKVGKLGLFAENAGIISYLAANALESKRPDSGLARGLKLAGHALTACGVGLGTIAGVGYIRRAAKPTHNS